MAGRPVLLLGGSGFIGRHVAARLVAQARHVIVPTRNRERARALLTLPTVQVFEADVHDDAQLASLMRSTDAVINLVGVLDGGRGSPWGPGFEKAHVKLVSRIVQAARAAGVRRLLHVSALGVHEGGERTLPSMYLRSKAAGERIVREAADLQWTVFRPSVVFGPGDSLIERFATLQRWLPLIPVGRADARLQPVWVGDVAHAIADSLDAQATVHRCYELAGPEVWSLRDLIRFAGELSGYRRRVVGLPDPLGRLQATLLEFAPAPLRMSRDNFASLSVDNVADGPIAAELRIEPTPLAAVAPSYFSEHELRLAEERRRAGH
ncbi:MAG: complex I NDUFA9 subunit family protein [Burkholderiaceae bacterium]|jgi:NADH dehydrogenase|nr:complex I NDUFA9 subunit family protein [Burkholderiaceae bacterium]